MTISMRYPLPARTGCFVNQNKLLGAADDLIAGGLPEIRRIVVGGITLGGRTTTAVEVAYRLSEKYFPDGVFYYEMSDDPDQASDGSEIIEDLFVALGVPHADIPVRETARRGLFRALTEDRSYLFVLDGVLSESQTRMLEPGPGGSVIMTVEARAVTSLGSPGCVFWELDELTSDAALQIFALMVGQELVDAERAAARAVVEQCDRLPGVLIVVASDIRRSTGIPAPIAEMAERLRDEQRRPAVRVASPGLGAVYRGLSEPVQVCYRALGLQAHGGVVSADSLAVATALSRETVAESLIELANLHFVRRRGSGRYRTRRIVRDHARDIDRRPDQRRVAEECLVQFYDERIIAADRLLAPERPWRRLLWPDLPPTATFFADAEMARQWLRDERVAIENAFAYAYRNEEFDLVVRWCVHLWPFHEKEKDTKTLVTMHRMGLQAAVQLGSRAMTSLLKTQLGFARYWRYELERAVTLFEEAVAMADDPQLEASALEGLGLALLELGLIEQAREAFRRNEILAGVTGDGRRITMAEFHRAKSEEPKQALPVLHRVARKFAEMPKDETENEAKAWYWLGRMLTELDGTDDLDRSDPLDAAEAQLQRALEVMETRSRPFDTGQIRFALGEVARRRSEREPAVVHYRETAAAHYAEALSLFTSLDFAAPADRARAALAVLGDS